MDSEKTFHKADAAASSADARSECSVLQKLEVICEEIFDRWDKDQRSGKLLTALAGRLKNYRADVTEVRAALAQPSVPAGGDTQYKFSGSQLTNYVDACRKVWEAARPSVPAEVEQLRAALKPFADAANSIEQYHDGNAIGCGIVAGDLRRARAAIEADQAVRNGEN